MTRRETGGVRKRGAIWWIHYRVAGERYFESAETRDERAARAFLAQRRREIREGTWAPPVDRKPAVLTVAAYIDAWIERRRLGGVRTVDDEAYRLRSHVLPEIGSLPLGEVTRPQIRELVAKVAAHVSETTGERLAPRTVLGVYRTLATAFADARDDGLIAASPCSLRTRKGELPKKKDADPKWRAEAVYTRDELETLISDERIPADRRTWYALAFLSGMRSSEVNARRWRDYEPPSGDLLGKIAIATQADESGERETKTDEVRECPVHPTLAGILDAWKRTGFPMLFGRHPQPDDLIVPSRVDGRSFRSKKTLERLREDLTRVGMRQVPSARHAMRATFLSLLEIDGANMAIARRATHAAPTDVVGGYTRIGWPDLCREIAKLRVTVRRGAKVLALAPARAASGDSLGANQAAIGVFLGEKERGGRDLKDIASGVSAVIVTNTRDSGSANVAGSRPSRTPAMQTVPHGTDVDRLREAAELLRAAGHQEHADAVERAARLVSGAI